MLIQDCKEAEKIIFQQGFWEYQKVVRIIDYFLNTHYYVNMNKITNTLVSLGLTEKEAVIYLTLYKLGETTAYQIARECGIKRPTVYMIMEELRKRGLVLIIPNPKKQVFRAKDPHEFIQECQSRIHESSRSLLMSLPKLSHPATNTIVFSGTGALTQGLSYGLRTVRNKECLALYARVKKGSNIKSEYLEHLEELHNLGFKLKSIVPSDSQDAEFRRIDKEYGFETKRVSHKLFSPPISIEIYDDLVKIIIHTKSEVIVIRDSGVADFYRQIFQFLFS